MARGKPLILSRKPGSKTREESKRGRESAFEAGALPKSPPADLAGLPAARAAWRAIMRAHAQLPGELFNALDRDYLVGYCLAVQNRRNALALAADLAAKYARGEVALECLLKVRAELRQSIRLVSDLEKQLYANPKSRGGVSPEKREKTAQELIDQELAELQRLGEED